MMVPIPYPGYSKSVSGKTLRLLSRLDKRLEYLKQFYPDIKEKNIYHKISSDGDFILCASPEFNNYTITSNSKALEELLLDYSERDAEGITDFCLAHELSHIALDHVNIFSGLLYRISKSIRKKMEIEADKDVLCRNIFDESVLRGYDLSHNSINLNNVLKDK